MSVPEMDHPGGKRLDDSPISPSMGSNRLSSIPKTRSGTGSVLTSHGSSFVSDEWCQQSPTLGLSPRVDSSPTASSSCSSSAQFLEEGGGAGGSAWGVCSGAPRSPPSTPPSSCAASSVRSEFECSPAAGSPYANPVEEEQDRMLQTWLGEMDSNFSEDTDIQRYYREIEQDTAARERDQFVRGWLAAGSAQRRRAALSQSSQSVGTAEALASLCAGDASECPYGGAGWGSGAVQYLQRQQAQSGSLLQAREKEVCEMKAQLLEYEMRLQGMMAAKTEASARDPTPPRLDNWLLPALLGLIVGLLVAILISIPSHYHPATYAPTFAPPSRETTHNQYYNYHYHGEAPPHSSGPPEPHPRTTSRTPSYKVETQGPEEAEPEGQAPPSCAGGQRLIAGTCQG